jgi:hypothetical protein
MFITKRNSVGNWLKACYHTLLTPDQGGPSTGGHLPNSAVLLVVYGVSEVVDVMHRV